MEERKRKDWRKEDIKRKSSGGKPASRYSDRSKGYKKPYGKTSPEKKDSPTEKDFTEGKPETIKDGIIIRKEGGEKKYEGSEPKPSEIIRDTPKKTQDSRLKTQDEAGEKKDEPFKRRTKGIGFGERDESGKRKPLERKPFKTQDTGHKTQDPKFGDRKPFGERKPLEEKKPFGQRNAFKAQEAKRRTQERKYGEKKPFVERKTEENNEYKPQRGSRPQTQDSRHNTHDQPYEEQKKPFANADTLRLNKFIANAGICSRRQADVHIAEGDVTVNGEVVRELGYRVLKTDDVKFNGKKVEYGRKVYILLNKPKDFITTKSDERDRKTVMELIKGATDETVYPVGRLDRNTTGLLLLTNDGELTQQLTHPSFGISKIYHVGLNKLVTKEDLEKIAAGIELEDGVAVIDDIAYADPKDKTQVGIELHIGKNRIVRRIFETLGYDVIKLDRVVYAGITKKDLPRGKWRLLTEKEVIQLKKFNEKR